jgi:hypothetical protein
VWEGFSFFNCSKQYLKECFYVFTALSCSLLIAKVFPWLTDLHRSFVMVAGAVAGYRGPKIPIDNFWWIVRLVIILFMFGVISSVVCNYKDIAPPEWYVKYNREITAIIFGLFIILWLIEVGIKRIRKSSSK